MFILNRKQELENGMKLTINIVWEDYTAEELQEEVISYQHLSDGLDNITIDGYKINL